MRKNTGNTLYFGLGSAALTADGRAQVQKLAKALLGPSLSGARLRIEGHASAVGKRADNFLLSKLRAETVARYLVDMGVAFDRLEIAGYGADRPLTGAKPLSPANRRVEIVVVK